MEITDFVDKIQQNAKSNHTRNIAQIYKSMLSGNCGIKESLISPETFDEIIEATNATPTIGSVYKFIRIYDLNDNSVDIQTSK